MNSRERVLKALNHEQPDRVPINFVGANQDIDLRLKRYFQLAADDDIGLLEALNVDFRVIELSYTGPEIHPEIQGWHIDPLWGFRTRWIENESGGYWDYCDFPLKDADLEAILNWPMPNPDFFNYESIGEMCRKYDDYFLIFGGPGQCDIINSSAMLRTMEQVLVDMALGEQAGLELFKRKSAVQLEIMARVLESADGRIDMLWIGEDLGTQNGPMISLEMYRKHLKPIHTQFADLAKQYKIPVMIHSCGSSSWAFKDFIEMGIEVVDTLQPEAANMEPEFLKSNFGERLCFHGCISTAGPLAFGTVEEAVADLEKTLEIMSPDGGYVMSPTHMIQDNTPTENVVAVYGSASLFCSV